MEEDWAVARSTPAPAEHGVAGGAAADKDNGDGDGDSDDNNDGSDYDNKHAKYSTGGHDGDEDGNKRPCDESEGLDKNCRRPHVIFVLKYNNNDSNSNDKHGECSTGENGGDGNGDEWPCDESQGLDEDCRRPHIILVPKWDGTAAATRTTAAAASTVAVAGWTTAVTAGGDIHSVRAAEKYVYVAMGSNPMATAMVSTPRAISFTRGVRHTVSTLMRTQRSPDQAH